jgi:hypothetical protein
MKTLSCLLLLLVTELAAAAETGVSPAQPLMGPEFTFTHPSWIGPGTGKIPGFPTSEQVVAKMDYQLRALRAHYVTYCESRGCQVIDRTRSFFDYQSPRFDLVFSDGWTLHFSEDPHVIEVASSPSRASEILANEERLATTLFAVMEKFELKPSPYYGSGHLNIDLKTAFSEDPKRLVNWLTDYFNHPALALGVFELDPMNAPAFVTLSMAQKNAYEQIVADVFEGSLTTIRAVIERMNRDVYRSNDKYHSVRLHENRLEIRAMRAQKGADEFSSLASLFEKRIQLTNRLTDEGKILPVMKNAGVNSPNQAISQFHFYVTDTGLEFDPYRKFLRGPLRYASPYGEEDRGHAYRDRGVCGSLFVGALDFGLKIFNSLYSK